jgi:hypothetical protein
MRPFASTRETRTSNVGSGHGPYWLSQATHAPPVPSAITCIVLGVPGVDPTFAPSTGQPAVTNPFASSRWTRTLPAVGPSVRKRERAGHRRCDDDTRAPSWCECGVHSLHGGACLGVHHEQAPHAIGHGSAEDPDSGAAEDDHTAEGAGDAAIGIDVRGAELDLTGCGRLRPHDE